MIAASPMMLAALLNPALFWGGAAAVSVPILIHLLARRRFRRIRWAAMAFLVDAEKRNRRRVRIEELILLALRCLAVFLIGLFIARPFMKATGIAAVLGGSERTERIFLLDDSFSMGYVSEGRTALDRAKEGVTNLVHRLREHAPGDTVTLLRTSEPRSPVVLGALLDDKQIEQLLARLEAIEPSQQALSVSECLDAVEQLLKRDAGTMGAALYVLSDFQRIDWVSSGSAGAGAKSAPASGL
ncbi:MAG TPA: BatA domain-containing protein, partial [Phycisphaerae bacterium]|nr:BatA domain-containing protein [Phycisphaerae bacterium]